jgi:hypothetical protein
VEIEMRYAVESDIAAIAADARQADVDEIAAQGRTVVEAMTSGMALGDWSATGLIDGVPVCMFGVVPASILSGIGIPWLITTNKVARHDKVFLRRCRPVVAAMLASYPRLSNIVAEDNTVARKWLAWLGFEFKAETIEVNGVTFRQFRKGEF